MLYSDPIPITPQNAASLLLQAIAQERKEAEEFMASLPEWKRRQLSDPRYSKPDRIAETEGFVRFSPSRWLTPTRAEKNNVSAGIRELEKRGLVECRWSGNRIIYVRLTGRGRIQQQREAGQPADGN